MRCHRGDFIWIEVTTDEYRHIVNMADTAQELADKCGVKRGTVISAACRLRRKGIKGRFERIYVGKNRQIRESDC